MARRALRRHECRGNAAFAGDAEGTASTGGRARYAATARARDAGTTRAGNAACGAGPRALGRTVEWSEAAGDAARVADGDDRWHARAIGPVARGAWRAKAGAAADADRHFDDDRHFDPDADGHVDASR